MYGLPQKMVAPNSFMSRAAHITQSRVIDTLETEIKQAIAEEVAKLEAKANREMQKLEKFKGYLNSL